MNMVSMEPFDFYNMMNKENSISDKADIINKIFTKQTILPKSQLETYAELSTILSIFPVHYNSKVAAIKKWRKRCRKKHDFTKDSYIDQEGGLSPNPRNFISNLNTTTYIKIGLANIASISIGFCLLRNV